MVHPCRFWSVPGVSPGTKPVSLLYKRHRTGLDSTIRVFADDIIAYLVIKSNSGVLSLQRDQGKLNQWEQLWKMTSHPDQCNVVTIYNKTQVQFNYCLHGHILESVDKAK